MSVGLFKPQGWLPGCKTYLIFMKVVRTSVFICLKHIAGHIYFNWIDGFGFLCIYGALLDCIGQWEHLFCLGTWQTYVVKDQSVWHKINKESPMEYAATITVNPLTALRMLEDFITLNPGTGISLVVVFFSFMCLVPNSLVCIGDAIVQNGATSIVGQCIIQLAQYRGVHSINVIRDRCLFKISALISRACFLLCLPIYR